MAGVPDTYTVQRVRVQKRAGRNGVMLVVLEYEATVAEVNEDPTQPQYEIEWTQLEKAIEQHPRYRKGWTAPGGTAVTRKQFALIQEYIGANSDRRNEIFNFDTSLGLLEGEPLALELLCKKLRGIESYTIEAPIVRSTAPMMSPNSRRSAGDLVVTPPVPGYPTGYSWKRTADRSTRTGRHGKWQNSKEWTGVEDIDTQLYPVPKSAAESERGIEPGTPGV